MIAPPLPPKVVSVQFARLVQAPASCSWDHRRPKSYDCVKLAREGRTYWRVVVKARRIYRVTQLEVVAA